MKTKTILLSFVLLYLLSSCNNSLEDEISTNSEVIKGEMTHTYKGKCYYTTYQVMDSVIIYDSKEVNELMDILEKKENLATLVHRDDSVEYFDSYEEMNELFFNLNSTRALPPHDPYKNTTTAGHLVVYEDSKKKGKSYSCTINNSNNFAYGITDLRTIGLDDKISSFTLQCDFIPQPSPYDGINLPKNVVYVSFYEDPDYKGHSIHFYATPECPWREIHYLKSYQVSALSRNWNDRISSLFLGTRIGLLPDGTNFWMN